MAKKHILNRFFARNFVGCSVPCQSVERVPFDTAFSDSLYDQVRGITHCLHHYDVDNPECTRFVSDVEIAMSSDTAITSMFSADHRNAIRMGLVDQPHSPVNGQPTDEQLMANGGIRHLERDEIVAAVSANMDALDRSLPRLYPRDPAPSPTPSEPVKTE